MDIDLTQILERHAKWLAGDENGVRADLSRTNLSGANLSRANLSRAIGLLSASEYLVSNFEKVADGVIVYKTFGLHYSSSDAWKIEPGETIAEVVNPCRTCDCACGINVGTRNWVEQSNTGRLIWKCLIRWEWLPDVVVPYNTNGKIRAGKVQLLEVVEC